MKTHYVQVHIITNSLNRRMPTLKSEIQDLPCGPRPACGLIVTPRPVFMVISEKKTSRADIGCIGCIRCIHYGCCMMLYSMVFLMFFGALDMRLTLSNLAKAHCHSESLLLSSLVDFGIPVKGCRHSVAVISLPARAQVWFHDLVFFFFFVKLGTKVPPYL